MNYKCVIIDDEDLARGLIETYLSQLPGFEIVASCANAIEASKILNDNKIDLLFLDIEMPVLKGTDFFKNLVDKPKVIFTTAYRDYAHDGFELDAIDYLVKPIFFDRFFKAVQKFLSQQNTKESTTASTATPIKNDFIFVAENRKQVKIELDNILYIESIKDYIKIYLKDSLHTIKYSISAFHKELDYRFIRIHRSYIVNSDKVTAYTTNDVEIGQIEIPIGGNYKENFILNKHFKK
ncbi:MAG: LytTR family DNA-binding domain-containing protein [Cellulophaga sp.]